MASDSTLLSASAVTEIARLAAVSEPFAIREVCTESDIPPLVYAVSAHGMTVTDITALVDRRRDTPLRRTGCVDIRSVDSLIAFGLRMREPNSVLFADRAKAIMRLVFNYHDAVNELAGAPPANPLPRHGDFWAALPLQRSRAYTEWRTIAGADEALTQQELAQFIEEHVTDLQLPETLVDPVIRETVARLGLTLSAPSEVLAYARRASLVVREQFGQTGETEPDGEISYLRAVETSRAIPGAFLIALPVFDGDAAYQFLVRLRMVRVEKSIAWQLTMPRVEEAYEDAFKVAAERVSVATLVPLFMAAL